MLFMCPLLQDLQVLRSIFALFNGASGLGCLKIPLNQISSILENSSPQIPLQDLQVL
jgi:hypothetical protein